MKRTLKSSKSHNGCQRCKARKLKCDETRPACNVCTKAGVECPGCVPQLRWSTKHEKFGQADSRNASRDLNGRVAGQKRGADGSARATTTSPAAAQDVQRLRASSREAAESPNEPATRSPANAEAAVFAQSQVLDPLEWLDFENGALDHITPNNTWTPYDELLADASMMNSRMLLGSPDGLGQFGPWYGDTQNNSPTSTSAIDVAQQNSHDQALLPHQSHPKKNSSLLRTFYRLATPTASARFSEEHLVQHYFAEVCPLFSSYGSNANPFHRLVKDLWTDSTTIHRAVQSMAIAHLSNQYPYMAPLGRAKRSQAWGSVQADPSDEKFYLDAFMHWEMLASFFEPVAMTSFPLCAPDPPILLREEAVTPHPWTGIAPELHFALAEIGRLSRRRTNRLAMKQSNPQEMMQKDEMDCEWASSLERLVESIQLPAPDDIVDHGDEKTSRRDLLWTTEAYRYVGLLEIYSIFPSLLSKRVDRGDPFALIDEHVFLPPTDDTGFAEKQDAWLSAIALHALRLIKDIPLSSAACRMHLLVLAFAGSQLRLPSEQTTVEYYDRVLEMRRVVDERMLALSRKHPQGQVLQILDIIKEAWESLNRGERCVHWLKIACEHGWQTLLG
ncbi:C6 zinc finger domain protein [Zymoseptoria brevis]|uniref:C6 zinc finger domain protein n=1 Tax=Zymoseptoria brevis TaxID=1047168 RepID=A0A0F4GGN5_9PEZI|nr:C6 zinc finger domain protein [Zymoseptoria brevis]